MLSRSRVSLLRLMTHVVLFAGALQADQSPANVTWLSFKSNVLNLQVSVPVDWTPAKMPKALAFRYDDQTGSAAIGIMKSDQTGTINEAVDKQFEHDGRPANWVRSPARVDGMRAIKIIAPVPKSPTRKMVTYYIETPQGMYLVQCQATADQWSRFGPIFTTILTKLKFLP